MEPLLQTVKKLVPKKLFSAVQPAYHSLMALLGALIYDFPSRQIYVIAVTGTKGKTTTIELINSILEEAGNKTALAGTLRFKILDKEVPNMYKMTMPGRLFQQWFLRQAVKARCTHAIMEMTSEGAKQFRHKFIDLDIVVFTNLAPEHIESHGSYEKYLDAKLSIARELGRSLKKHTAIVANINDPEGKKFLHAAGRVRERISYSLADAHPYRLLDSGIEMFVNGMHIRSSLRGKFNIMNILAAVAVAKHVGVSKKDIAAGIKKCSLVRGRMERIDGGQRFEVVVDYAHTPDSLTAVYETLLGDAGEKERKNLICVLGSTGGGRDAWKRPAMGAIADKFCSRIILTNEDPYDEDPKKIALDVKSGIREKLTEIIMDRREAIERALCLAQDERDVVVITGKGTDPYIMEANGKKTPWDDATVAREELKKVL